MIKSEFPINTLNNDDYEFFEEQVLDEKEDNDDISRFKIDTDNVLIISYDGDISHFVGYDVYNFHASSLYIVDELNKKACYKAEPRDYTISEYANDKNSIYIQDIIPIADKAILKYKPSIIIFVE